MIQDISLDRVRENCRAWSELLSRDEIVQQVHVVSPKSRPTAEELFNPHDKRFHLHPQGIQVSVFINIILEVLRGADLQFEQEQWY